MVDRNKRRYKRCFSPTMRLKICSEYLSGECKKKGISQKKLAQKYNISLRTLQYWLDDYYADLVGCIDIYKYIMGILAAGGYRKAAEYLRDNAIEIMTNFTGNDLPEDVDISFDGVLGDVSEDTSNDDIADDIAMFDRFRK